MLKSLTDWGARCNLKFNPEKTVAVLFTRKQTRPSVALTFEGQKLRYSKTVVYLGVTLDSKLTWKPHVDAKITKAKKLLASISSLVTGAHGPNPKLMRWAFNGIVKPMVSYGAVVWAHEINTSKIKTELRKLNRKALNTMVLAPPSTPTRGLEVILDVPPLYLHLSLIHI